MKYCYKGKNEDLDSPIIVGALCTPENFFGHGENIGFWRGGGGGNIEFWKICFMIKVINKKRIASLKL